MHRNTISPFVLLTAWLVSLAVVAALSFVVTWGFFETLGAWRWPM